MSQDEFDFAKGKEKAQEGMSKAERAIRVQEWRHDAGQYHMSLPVGTEYSADDLTRRCGVPDQGANKVNVVGAFFSGLAAMKFIRWTGKTTKSERVDRHTGMNRIWVKIK